MPLTSIDSIEGCGDWEARRGFVLAAQHAPLPCIPCRCPRPSRRLACPWQPRYLTQRLLPAHGSPAQTEEMGATIWRHEGALSCSRTQATQLRPLPMPEAIQRDALPTTTQGINPEAAPCAQLTGTNSGDGHGDRVAQRGFAFVAENVLLCCDTHQCPRPF